MSTFYFTHGTEGQAYFGGWTEVIAENRQQAEAAFLAFHPLRNGFIPCASVYTEEEMKKTTMWEVGNFGYRCHETISLTRSITKENNND